MIELTHLGKWFGKRKANKRGDICAVADVSFCAPPGKITGLLGPNGAGKTTLLRMLSTLLVPDEGSARVADFDIVAERQEVRRRIGVLSDARGLYPRLSAFENIAYFGALYGMDDSLLNERIALLLDMLDLRSLTHRKTEGFSQGERMKVAIARALIHDPPVVLLDEPTNGLDVMSVRLLRDFLRVLRDQGKCLIFSSHVMSEVAALCDTIVVLNHGRLIAQGTADDFRNQTVQSSLEDAFFALLENDERSAA
ncbi:MAG: ATP-binding cassette domain-containing protein [Burkholderiales bacterium]|jgi:sodium transport system ATP-binding protein|nr:ATP-binding cassette domain-containing protein [Burkholderiales bacterium]